MKHTGHTVDLEDIPHKEEKSFLIDLKFLWLVISHISRSWITPVLRITTAIQKKTTGDYECEYKILDDYIGSTLMTIPLKWQVYS